MAKPASSEIAKIGVGIPEWCLYVYVNAPTAEEIADTTKYIVDHPDIARLETIVIDAAFCLICRSSSGERIWGADDLVMLSKRQRNVIERIVSGYMPVAKPVIEAIELILRKRERSDDVK